jgi:hypothetical protein
MAGTVIRCWTDVAVSVLVCLALVSCVRNAL